MVKSRIIFRGFHVIRNVLVGVDGSGDSDRALDFALDLAEKFSAPVTILHVSESLEMSAVPQESAAYPSNTAVIAKDLRAIENEVLTKSVEHAKTVKPDVQVTAILKEGDPATQIVDTAKDGGFDIIVVGNRGLSKMRERLLGSVSERVLHYAPCPIVVVK